MIMVKSEKEICSMRASCKIAAEVLEKVGKRIAVGVSTKDLENIAVKEIKSLGAKSMCLGYRGFPGVICTSVNDVVVHGIPSAKKKLKEGDIISLDVCVIYEGFCGDVANTYPVGSISSGAKKLMAVASESLNNAINKCTAGCRVGDISQAIQLTVEKAGFSASRDFTGHGIGRFLHEDPVIPNYGRAGAGVRIPENACLAIEAMIHQGGWQIRILPDQWTAVTLDGKAAAHFEHTVLVKKTGAEILTV